MNIIITAFIEDSLQYGELYPEAAEGVDDALALLSATVPEDEVKVRKYRTVCVRLAICFAVLQCAALYCIMLRVYVCVSMTIC